jgi:hypothetical protein
MNCIDLHDDGNFECISNDVDVLTHSSTGTMVKHEGYLKIVKHAGYIPASYEACAGKSSLPPHISSLSPRRKSSLPPLRIFTNSLDFLDSFFSLETSFFGQNILEKGNFLESGNSASCVASSAPWVVRRGQCVVGSASWVRCWASYRQ